MPQVDINFFAVLLAAISAMILGAAWYSPLLFGKKWIRLMNKSDEELNEMKKGMGKAYGVTFVGVIIMAYVLAYIIGLLEVGTVFAGVKTAFWVWLGFVATTSLGGVLFEARPRDLYFINNAYQLVSLVLMGIIIGVWV